MRRTGSSILWALLLIGVGVVLILQNQGIVSRDLRIWPLVVAWVGVWLLIERLAVGRITGGLVWPFVLIAVGGVFVLRDLDVIDKDVSLWPVLLIAIGLALILSAVPERRRAGPVVTSERVPLESARQGRVVIEHGAGQLVVGSTLEPGVLVEGTFRGGVRPKVRREGDRVDVTLSHAPGALLDQVFPWNWGGPGPLEWHVGITRRVPVTLEVRSGASKQEIDLTDIEIPDLVVDTGASRIDLRLPGHGRTTARVKAGAARLNIRVPDRVGARIKVEGGVSSVKVDEIRFPRSDGVWESRGFAGAEHRLDLAVSVGAAEVEIR
jgi:hypothetical protein